MYIDELEDYSLVKNKKIIAIDPGKCDLIYCVDDASKNAVTFRYSQDQRRKETKSKKYRKIRDSKKNKVVFDNKTVIELETELSLFNSKTMDFNKFKEYVQKKNHTNSLLYDFYNQRLFRKLKLGSHINTKRSEQKMINAFKNKFGIEDSGDVIVCIGDWEQRKQMKFKEPTIGKGVRNIFRRNGIGVFLVDEFRTSKACSICAGGECVKFKVRPNPRPYKDGLIEVHGLLRCKNGAEGPLLRRVWALEPRSKWSVQYIQDIKDGN